ncbi:hypothetical protein [Rubinisphaera brasiliensis]|uniref:Uncharacterized protein n=1 Tax=Rubinisphaera brasiliensis (strain ATCC 49424 / DSM 5305 / JCM 21570 / IAM 15109 / NBRC 103401 / IFAM 1448) TaxID=756272 RepID=F0SJ84_RUBBR|nr:hypothetical protein [Rubinisphaera brasiliensis]ADY58626.1 hypothetical protein Plabr_1005 [Rubinisphaera brasiliensis DSM 5305]
MRKKFTVSIESLENKFPASSGEVFAKAQAKAFASGLAILISEDGAVYELTASGEKRFVKNVAPPVDVKPGLKIKLK